MTMSGERTEPSAPLDLRTKGRERAGGGQGEADASRIDPPPASPSARADSSAQTRTQPSSPKRGDDLKPATSSLPIRKRPVPSNTETEPRGTPNPAKAPRYPNTRNGLSAQPQTQRSAPSPAPAATHGHSLGHPQHSLGYCLPGQYRYSQPSSLHFHLCEDADQLLNEVALATHQDEDGDTALHIAVAQENEAVVQRLIKILCRARKDLDLYNNLRQTPLHLAVITHQPSVVQALLLGGADPGALDRHGQNTLHLCCEHSQESCLDVILSHLAHSQCCPSAFLDSRNYEGLTPLHLAVQKGNRKLARMLLQSSADINAVDIKSGRSPLVHAVENNCMEMVNFLIENGCNVNAQSYSGNTALHSACGRGEVEAVRVLLKNGADSSLKNYHNDTAVMVAKNKKVSDVLRGKTARGHALKTQHSFNGATSNFNRSASLSPVVPQTHSPHSQSGESMSGNQSPTETQENNDLQRRPRTFHDMMPDSRDNGMSMQSLPFFSPYFDTLMPVYYPGLQRHPYHPETQLILFPTGLGRSEHLSHGLPPTSIATQSRPSSHNSDQSDISNMSVSSEGKVDCDKL